MADINGTSGGDTLNGTAGADLIYGLGGNDAINGQDGSDIVYAGDGDDTLTTSIGPTDTLYGGNGNDHFFASRPAIMSGDAGTDIFTVFGFGHQSRILDFQVGTAGDRLDLASFADTNTAWNGVGNPFALGYLTLLQVGDDVFIGYDVDGGGDQSVPFLYLLGVDLLDLGAANFIGAAPILDRNDTAGADSLAGTAALEIFHLGAGNDSVDGGRGTDTAAYAGGMAGYRVSFVDGAWIVVDVDHGNGDDGVDTLRNIEELRFADGYIHLEPGLPRSAPFNPAAGVPYSITGTVAASPTGGHAAVWSSGSGQVLVQRYDDTGAAAGPVNTDVFGVASTGSPAIDYFSDGGFVIVGQQTSGGLAPIARLFGADGTPQGPAFQVSNGAVPNPYDFKVEVLPDDSFVVAWQSGPSGDRNIFARHYAADGTALGGVLDLGDYGSGQRAFDLVALSDDSFFLVRMLGGAVTGQAYATDGSAIGSPVAFNATAGGEFGGLALDRLADGRLIVAYAEDHAIAGRIFDPATLTLSAEFALSTTDMGLRMPDVAALDDGGFVVLWEANGFAGRYAFAQRFGADAARIGEEIMVANGPAQTAPTVAALPGGSWTAIWQDGGGASSHVSAVVYGPPAIVTTEPVQTITGTSGDDSLSTGAGASVVHGLGGNDYIYDSWFFADYADELHGDEGNDQIYAWGGDDLLFGGAGDDILAGGFGADTLDGGDDNDSLIDNQAGGDTLRGGAGDDLIAVGHPTSPTLLGPLGTLTTIEGGSGNDRIELNYSRTPQTLIDAGDGDDHVRLTRSAGIVTLTLGAGSDTIEFARDFGGWPFTGLHITDFGADDRIIGLSEALFYAIGPWDGVANPFGTGQLRLRQSGADTLLERNFLGTGDSWDTILSFDNTDAASLTAARLDGFDPTGAAAAAQALDGTSAGEDLYGGQGDDVVHGNDGDDVLTGNAGNDSLYGGDGDDTLVGGVGTDLLDGGAGNDDFTVTANGADDVIGGDGDDTLFYRRDDRNFSGYPIAGGTSYIDMGAGNDQLTIHNFAGELIVDAGAGDDTIFTLGYGYQLTLGAGADSITISFVANTLTVTDFNPAEDRFTSFSSFLRQETDFVSGDPYALGFIRLVQQGADTAVQLASFTSNVFGQTPLLLLGVDARTLNAANLGGYAPDGIWAFGTSADDVLAGGSGIDRLSDDQGGSDTLDGGAGNDILSWSRTAGATGTSHLAGGAGDDRIDLSGGSAAGTVFADGGADNDAVHLASVVGTAIVTLGAGEDTITLDPAASGIPAGSAVAITDFATGAGGDALALTPFLTVWLTGWNPADNPFATGHARLAQSGSSTLLQFDRDGGGDSWTTALTLENTDAAAFTAANLGGWDSGTFGNQAPALAAGPGTPTSYYEGDPAVRIAPQATLADADSPDFAGGTLTVTLAGAVADDLVAVRSDSASGIDVAGGVVSYYGTAIGTVSGGAGAANLIVSLNGDANAAAVEALIENLIYVGTTDAMIAGQRVLTVALTDGDGGAAQIVSQFSAHAINDAPTIAGLAGDTAHYTEGGTAVLLDVGAAALVADADSANFAGGTLTVAITANGNPNQDMLGVQAGGRLGVYGNQIAIDGLVFASSEGGWPGSDLVFTFNEVATPTAVSLLLQALTYFNFDGIAPSAATRTVTLTLTDGDGTDLGGTDSRVATVQVEIAAINEAPQLSDPPEPIVLYPEGSAFAQLFGGVSLGDAEFRAGYGGGSLTLAVTGGDGAIELPAWSWFHAVANGGGFDLVYDNGSDPAVLVGRIAGLGTASIIVDSFAPADANIFSYLVAAFVYSVPADDAPSTALRTATLTFNDGGNGNGTGALSATRTQTIQIAPANDAPVLGHDPAAPIDYAANTAAVALFQDVTIADPDLPGSFVGGMIELTTGGIGARLVLLGARFTAAALGGGGFALTDTASGQQIGIMTQGDGTLSVALAAGATPEAVTALARSFGFQTVGDEPGLGSRGVFLTLHDGGNIGSGGSLASNSVVEIVAVGPDPMTGTGGDDILAGSTGADVLTGRLGNDTYYVDNAGDVVIETAGQGNDRVATSVTYTLAAGAEVETLEAVNTADTAAMDLTANDFVNLIIGNAGMNLIFANGGNDTLIGNGGNDFLIGGTGADIMYGGTGNDTYYVDDDGDRAYELAGEGTADRIATLISYTLDDASEVELLEAVNTLDTNAMDLTGSNSANLIIGNAGTNLLFGLGGNDQLVGLNGNDFLVGGTGADLMYGGTGDDTYYVDDLGDQANEVAGEGNDRIATSISYTLDGAFEVELLEAVNLTATDAMNLSGSDSGQTIIGNDGVNILFGAGGNDTLISRAGNDVLIGGTGDDVMHGGTGDDTYHVDSASDQANELNGQGNDRVATSVSYALSAGSEIETLEAVNTGDTSAMNLTGNGIANTITGSAGANVIDGKSGNDILTGLGGADTFAFTTALGAGNVDRIVDFAHNVDTIALDDAIFTALTTGALGSAKFHVGATATDTDQRIIYDQATGNLYYDADGSGGAAQVLFATLDTHPVLTASDFTVI